MSAPTIDAALSALLCGCPTLGESEDISFDGSVQTSSIGSSGALNAGWYRLSATEDCRYKVGTNPTAAADGTSAFLKAGAIDFVPIAQSGTYKIAAIKETTAGKLNIQEYKVVG